MPPALPFSSVSDWQLLADLRRLPLPDADFPKEKEMLKRIRILPQNLLNCVGYTVVEVEYINLLPAFNAF